MASDTTTSTSTSEHTVECDAHVADIKIGDKELTLKVVVPTSFKTRNATIAEVGPLAGKLVALSFTVRQQNLDFSEADTPKCDGQLSIETVVCEGCGGSGEQTVDDEVVVCDVCGGVGQHEQSPDPANPDAIAAAADDVREVSAEVADGQTDACLEGEVVPLSAVEDTAFEEAEAAAKRGGK